MTYREVEKRLKENGWVVARQKGSHVQFVHRTTGKTVTVPNHAGKDISPGVMGDLKRKTGLSFQ